MATRTGALLDTVPVRYLIVGEDVVATERYTAPVVSGFPDRWEHVHSTPGELAGVSAHRTLAIPVYR